MSIIRHKLYLFIKASLAGKLACWTLLLQEFEFEIYHQPGVQHALADYLSWLEFGEEGDGARYNFPVAELFKVATETVLDETKASDDTWLTNMHQFLSTRLPQEELNHNELKRLVVQSHHFFLLKDTLYHKGDNGI